MGSGQINRNLRLADPFDHDVTTEQWVPQSFMTGFPSHHLVSQCKCSITAALLLKLFGYKSAMHVFTKMLQKWYISI